MVDDSHNAPFDKTKFDEVLEALVGLKDNEGNPFDDIFEELPSKRYFPDYYQIIQKPICYKMMRNKAKTGKYLSMGDFYDDIRLMVSNAQTYNMPGSLVYECSVLIANTANSLESKDGTLNEEENEEMESSINEEHKPGTNEIDVPKVIQNILDALHEEKDEQGRFLIDIFIDLPSKRLYPDYYEIIKSPMTIKMLEKRFKKGEYTTLESFVKDLNQMFINAKTYNAPGSFVYEDAEKLSQLSSSLISSFSEQPKEHSPATSKHEPEETPASPTPSVSASTSRERSTSVAPSFITSDQAATPDVLKSEEAHVESFSKESEKDQTPIPEDVPSPMETLSQANYGAFALIKSFPSTPVPDFLNFSHKSVMGRSTFNMPNFPEPKFFEDIPNTERCILSAFICSPPQLPLPNPLRMYLPCPSLNSTEVSVITLAPQHSFLNIVINLNPALALKSYTIITLLNGKRLGAGVSTPPSTLYALEGIKHTEEPIRTVYEAKLSVGLNCLEFVLGSTEPVEPPSIEPGLPASAYSRTVERERFVLMAYVQP
ncbi:Chromatin structure-remodeling complex subunit rsc4 [Schizosaccharomyces pombe]